MSREPFLTKLTLQNFRSIRNETVEFANPLFLVGKNGSGKSNFVDALAFLSECMDQPLRRVIEDHGGLAGISYFLIRPDELISMHLTFALAEGVQAGDYSFSIKVHDSGEYTVTQEQLNVVNSDGEKLYINRTEDGFSSSVNERSSVPDKKGLMVLGLGSFGVFAPVLKALAAMRVYAFDVRNLRDVQARDSGHALKRDGSNLASVVRTLNAKNSSALTQIGELLATSTPGIRLLGAEMSNDRAVTVYEQDWGNEPKVVWPSGSMSDGTLIASALIVSAMQTPPPTLIVIEEPEAHLHPGAFGMISDVLQLTSASSQVVITTHSPELLDMKWLQPENLRVVEWEDRETRISKLGPAPVQALQQHLMGAGGLLRANALDAAPRPAEGAVPLFDETRA